MDYKIFLIQIILVFSQVDGLRVGNPPPPSVLCNDGRKGDGVCDEINDIAECDYDDGDCCNWEWVGDGECDARNNFSYCYYDDGDCCVKDYAGDGECDNENNFIGCTNNAVTGKYGTNFKQTKTGDTGYQNDGGDCFPRECFVDEDDPLDAAFTTKYGKFWYNEVNDDHVYFGPPGPDPQGFFSAIENQNECRALSCLMSGESPEDFRGIEFIDFFCDTTHLNGSSYQSYYDYFGSGCYCGLEFHSVVPAECCFYDDCTWDGDIMIDCDDDAPQAALTRTYGRMLKKAGNQKEKKRYQGKK